MAYSLLQIYEPTESELQNLLPTILVIGLILFIVFVYRGNKKYRRNNKQRANPNLHQKNRELQYENKILQLEKENMELRRKLKAAGDNTFQA